MKSLIVSALILIPACSVYAADKPDNPDAAFYKHAAQGGLAEVELGDLARHKSSNMDVKEFGAMMVKDHSAANDKLKAVAASKNITLPAHLSVGERAEKGKLELLSGDTFDKSYIKGMIKDHQEDIAEFNKEADSGQDPDAVAFAKATLPTLKEHLAKIQSIAASAGVNGE
jgi:putative membrane protein